MPGELRRVSVTHPFHPRCGRSYELIAYKQTWGEYRVFFYDEQGAFVSLPAEWTDAVQPDPFVSLAAGRSDFRVEELCQLVALVAQLKAERG